MSNRKIHDMSASVPNKPSILYPQVSQGSERPLDGVPAPEGSLPCDPPVHKVHTPTLDGVATGDQLGLPEGHANVADKIVEKAEKVIGKCTNNSGMHERDELRETGGKVAAKGHAYAAHD